MLLPRSLSRIAITRKLGSLRSFTASSQQALATFPQERMASDKRYQPTGEVPDIRGDFDSPFSISNKFKTGRAAYLDHSATTPLDPRVLDSMLPYMVSFMKQNNNQIVDDVNSSFIFAYLYIFFHTLPNRLDPLETRIPVLMSLVGKLRVLQKALGKRLLT
jgi:hypothetical protein